MADKKKIALVGMAETTRDKAPWDDLSWEIWIINEMGHTELDAYKWIKRYNRLFQIHQRWDYMRGEDTNFNDPHYPEWLQNKDDIRKIDFPIMMIEEQPDIPGSKKYPLKEILDEFGPESRFFTCSFAYMIAQAIYENPDEIGVYGFEMSSETEYAGQRDSASFWIGVAIGRDIKIYIPEKSKMLGHHKLLYGYEMVPEITRMHLEIERNQYRKEEQKHMLIIQGIKGKMAIYARKLKLAGAQKGTRQKAMAEIQKLQGLASQELILVNWFKACRTTVDRQTKKLDLQLIGAGRPVTYESLKMDEFYEK